MSKTWGMASLMGLLTLVTFAGGKWVKADCPDQGMALNTSCTTNMPFPMIGSLPVLCTYAKTNAECSGNILGITNTDFSVQATQICQINGVGPPAPVTCYTYYACTWDPIGAKCKAILTTVNQGMPVYYRCTDPVCVVYWQNHDAKQQ